MDTEQAIINALYFRLQGDEELKDLMGESYLHLGQAPKDATFPYLTHRLDTSSAGDPWVIRNGTYYLNIWDRHQTAERMTLIRSRLLDILDRSYIGLIDTKGTFMTVSQPLAGEPVPILIAARVFLDTSGLILEETDIWHYVLQFSIRHTRALQEIDRITKEE